jgi:steroid 5-alpha reductase family enzyme
LPSSRATAFGWIVVTYVVACVAGAATFLLLPAWSPLARGAAADVVATIVVFGFSVGFNNSSFYDAYWSVAPPPLLLAWVTAKASSARITLVGLLVMAWAIRLTWNWARGWQGLQHEDWRYVKIRNDTGALYWPVSFLGIHFMPTVMVFLGCLGLYAAVGEQGAAISPLDFIAAIVTAFAIWLEATADSQLRAFVLSQPPREAIMDRGLWAWSRHPNYCGEVLFWWGVCLFGVAAIGPQWWLFIGPAAITCLFFFISIPLMEKRMVASRPAFAERQRRVSRLFLWFPKAS